MCARRRRMLTWFINTKRSPFRGEGRLRPAASSWAQRRLPIPPPSPHILQIANRKSRELARASPPSSTRGGRSSLADLLSQRDAIQVAVDVFVARNVFAWDGAGKEGAIQHFRAFHLEHVRSICHSSRRQHGQAARRIYGRH